MNRRLIFLLLILVALAVALPATLKLTPRSSPAKQKKTPRADLPDWAPAAEKTDHLEAVTVTITIPAASDSAKKDMPTPRCPQKSLSHVLGVGVSPGQGCVVLNLDENGAAAKAGIKLGDRLSADPEACPSTLAGEFVPGEEAREITWTVQRPVMKSPAPAAGSGKQAPS